MWLVKNYQTFCEIKKFYFIFCIYKKYLISDVLLLTNIFEEFIDTCLKFYRLIYCHYFSSPGLSWYAMLKMTGVKFKKIFDIDIYVFIEKGLRGAITYIAKRYAKANNKYMKTMTLKNRQNL